MRIEASHGRAAQQLTALLVGPRRIIRLLTLASGLVGVATVPCEAATPVIGTSTAGDPINTGHKYFTHYANGHYWVAYDTGGPGGSFNSSPDGVTWTNQGQVFAPPPSINLNSFANEWAVRYQGNTVIVAVYNAGGAPVGQRYYRSGTLNSNGTVTWSGALTPVGPADVTFSALNILIANGRPIMWRDDNTAGGAGAIWRGSAIASPTWTKTTADAPAMTGTSGGIFTAGALFPTGGANPDDLIVLRATTAAALTAGSHRLVAMKWNAATDTYDGTWYNVSTLNGGLAESMTTEVGVNADNANQKRFAAVRDTSGNLHAVYVNRSGDMAHYRKAVGFNDSWTRVAAGINPPVENIDMVALTALANNNLYLFYSKGDNRIYSRRFDGAVWSAETQLLDLTATALRRVLAPPELALDCSVGLAFVEGTASPWNVRFTVAAGGCSTLQTTTGAGTVTVTGPGSFRMRFNQAAGGGIDQFFDLVEDGTATTDLVGGDVFLRNLFIDEIVQGAGPFVFYFSSEGLGAKLDVLEATSARSRLRQTAFFGDPGGTGNLRDVFATGDYSIYSPGKVALSWNRWKTPSATVNYDTEELKFITHYGAAPPLNSWTSFHDAGALSPLGPAGSTFVLAKNDVAGASTDFLPIFSPPAFPVATQTVANAAGADAWQTLWRDNNTGTIIDATFRWLTYFKPTNLGNTGTPWTDPLVTTRASDYRVPSAITVGPGTQWQDAAENTAAAGDFFNESEAAYVFDLNPSAGQGLTFDISGSGANPRYSPFFKIRQWRTLVAPSTITVEGATKARNLDYKADVKPVARAHFAQDVLYHSTLESAASFTTVPQTGDPTGSAVNGAVTFPVARYGRGTQFSADGQYLDIQPGGNFDPAQGAIEFWYKPSYDYSGGGPDPDDHALFGYWIDASNYFYAYFEPVPGSGPGPDEGLTFAVSTTAGGLAKVVTGAGSGFTEYWRANDWVHLRFVWKADAVPASSRLEIYINGKLAPPSAASLGSYTVPVATEALFAIGDRGRSDIFDNNANGVIDEFQIFSSPDAPTPIAHGGLTSDPTEYLADGTRNFPLSFDPFGAFFRGEYLYIGADSKFRGLNVALATTGSGVAAGALLWEYWDGTRWSNLEFQPGFTDQTDSLTKLSGTVFWDVEPASWSLYSISGGPDLYYVRASLGGGVDYTTTPIESRIKTDILLFQHCEDITALSQTFAFSAPSPTEVDLLSFEAKGLDGAVELLWETASETNNLGFYLYRAESDSGPFERITPSPIPGLGSSPVGARYRYVDQGLTNGKTYHYLLEDYETTGKTKRHGPVSATPQTGATPPGGGSEPPPSPAPSPSRITYGDPDKTALRILEHTPHGVLVELTTGGFYAEPQPDGSVRLSIPGFTEENTPGSPAIPTRRAWIEALTGKQVQLASVRGLDVAAFSSLRPLAAEVREVVASRTGALQVARRPQAEGGLFRRKGLFPGEEARLLDTAFQGDIKKVLLELAPLRWDPRTGQLLLAQRLQVRLSFTGIEPDEHSRGGSRGRRYRERRSHRSRGVLARLSTQQEGLYAVRFEDVLGLRRGLDASRLRLGRQGSPVAFHLEPDSRRFGPGSTLYFWSEGASKNPYGNQAVYELELGDGPGLVMPVASAAPHGSLLDTYVHRLEREENLSFAAQFHVENLWTWASILASSSKSFSFEASRVMPGPGTARLELWLLGVTGTPDAVEHRVRLFLNGHFVGEPTWSSASLESLSVELSPALLQEGTNTLAIENANSFYSAVILDRFAVSYPRLAVAEAGVLEGRFASAGTASIRGLNTTPSVLDLSSPTPRWLSGVLCSAGNCQFAAEANQSYFVAEAPQSPAVEVASASRLKSTTNQYDYLVIGPQAFLDVAQPLLEHRRAQGLSSLAVSIEDVFDEFGFGEPTPLAIRDFLTYAFQKWAPPAPRYVLLLGDGTYDYKDHLKTGTRNQVPPVLFRSSFIWTAADPLYAAVNGEDSLPDLALGRLPASTPEEARIMVDKILAFENAGLRLDGQAVLVSDNPDSAGDFDAEADEIASTLLASRRPSRISLARLGREATRTAIFDAFAQGPSLLSYLGHGSQLLWAHENIFHASQVPSLAPQPQQPFVFTLNCLNGYFHSPYSDSLAEELVKAEGKGAIAAFSPSGLSFNDAAHLFHKAFLAELTQKNHPRLGDALLAAQAAYADTGASPEMIDLYHLFGDPALKIQ